MKLSDELLILYSVYLNIQYCLTFQVLTDITHMNDHTYMYTNLWVYVHTNKIKQSVKNSEYTWKRPTQ